MVTIKTAQRKIKINMEKLKKDARTILGILDYHDFELTIFLTTNKTIRAYNKKYRKKDEATDILSFAYYPDLKPGQRIVPDVESDKQLGDLIISLEYVQAAAKKLKTTLTKRLEVLLVHGICHLLGYDHVTDKQYAIMQAQEKKLLKYLR